MGRSRLQHSAVPPVFRRAKTAALVSAGNGAGPSRVTGRKSRSHGPLGSELRRSAVRGTFQPVNPLSCGRAAVPTLSVIVFRHRLLFILGQGGRFVKRFLQNVAAGRSNRLTVGATLHKKRAVPCPVAAFFPKALRWVRTRPVCFFAEPISCCGCGPAGAAHTGRC